MGILGRITGTQTTQTTQQKRDAEVKKAGDQRVRDYGNRQGNLNGGTRRDRSSGGRG
jgi:hypothetical protein